MEDLDKNLIKKLALELDLDSIKKLCLASKRFDKYICKDNIFWKNKLDREYPNTIVENSNFRKIYESLFNEKYSYLVFISYCNDNDQVLKFWDYIHKYQNVLIEDKMYEKMENLYPDFIERCGEEFIFDMKGDFPKGTKIWLAYSNDNMINLKKGFLIKEKAVNSVLKTIEYILKDDFDNREEIEEQYGKSIEEIYGKNSIEEILEELRYKLNNYGFFEIFNTAEGGNNFYIIKEFTI